MKNEMSEQNQAPAVEVEAVEVVGFRVNHELFGSRLSERRETAPEIICDQLMTVAQHSRMIAQRDATISEQSAEIERLATAKSNVIQQAEMQAQEARTQRAIVMQTGALVGCGNDYEMIGAVSAALKQAGASNLLDVSVERNALQRQLNTCQSGFERECADVDRLLGLLGLPADDYRMDGGFLNIGKILGRLNASRDGMPEGWRVIPYSSTVRRSGDRWEVYAPCGSGGVVNTHEIQNADVYALLDALAAAPTPAPPTGIYSADPLACSGCVSGCFRCAPAYPKPAGWSMSDPIKRYDPFGYDGLSAFMQEDQHGEWVRGEDYDRDVQALIHENKTLKQDLKLSYAAYNDCEREIEKLSAENARLRFLESKLIASRVHCTDAIELFAQAKKERDDMALKLAEAEKFIEMAFNAHPNLDLDIAALQPNPGKMEGE